MTSLRLFLHVLAASVWVGGMIVMAGIIPSSRRIGTDAASTLAAAFDRIAWPAFGVAVLTGLWNVMALPMQDLPHPWIELHVLAVVVTGVAAAVHTVTRRNRAAAAAAMATATLFAAAAMYLGIVVSTTLPT
ncbi:MAG: hypothetical protein JST64_04465 [Actinobacteria bacterium]|nr:hypothetical protein [Actinomycetota bacterium]